MGEPITYEFELTDSAATVGALLRTLGTDLERGATMRLAADGDVVTVEPPEELELEVEVESLPAEDGGEDEVEVEFELEWAASDAVAVHEGDAGDEEATVDGESEADDDAGNEEAAVDGESEADSDAGDDPWAAGEPATVEDAPSQATFELFRDTASEWRWRLRHDNGNVIATGGEGYSSLANARNGMHSVMRNAPGAGIEREE